MHELPQLTPETSAALGRLQSLDDSIAFRAARLAGACPDCSPGGRCEDHTHDERLVAAYRQHHAAAYRDFLERFDPADVQAVLTGSDGTPPTVLACALALKGRLRELAAAGPFVTTLAGVQVIVELRGRQLIEPPLAPRGSPESGHPG